MEANSILVKNIQNQLTRLVDQLEDIEAERSNITEDEYNEMKTDTAQQLVELNQSLEKMENGGMSTVDGLTRTKVELRSAVSKAFNSLDVFQLFKQKDTNLLRQKLKTLEDSQNLNDAIYKAKKLEILQALYNLKENLSKEELQYIHQNAKHD